MKRKNFKAKWLAPALKMHANGKSVRHIARTLTRKGHKRISHVSIWRWVVRHGQCETGRDEGASRESAQCSSETRQNGTVAGSVPTPTVITISQTGPDTENVPQFVG
jgi:hypothetical protein